MRLLRNSVAPYCMNRQRISYTLSPHNQRCGAIRKASTRLNLSPVETDESQALTQKVGMRVHQLIHVHTSYHTCQYLKRFLVLILPFLYICGSAGWRSQWWNCSHVSCRHDLKCCWTSKGGSRSWLLWPGMVIRWYGRMFYGRCLAPDRWDYSKNVQLDR